MTARDLVATVGVMPIILGCHHSTWPRQTVSSQDVGCAPEDIQITHESTTSWIAICKGKQYYCTGSKQESGTHVMCSPADY